ncbi:SDR family oxidoreductase [Cohnella sp. GCM10027633]|uniref:SDR family oxidoreductase n=1 Tax=unclassified Cohnella TaxID=2636738 RepID=UPI00363CC7E5
MILVTGATGFTGSHFIRKLVETDAEIRCLVRKDSDISQLDPKRVEIVYGSFEDKDSYRKALVGADKLVNIASLGFGHAETIVNGAVDAGVNRAIFVSTTAIFTNLPAKTKAVRMAAEKAVTDSRLNYTILRPTMIFGTEKDRNMTRLVRFLNRFPAMPIVGDGNSKQQPIYVEDLAQGILNSLLSDQCNRKSFNLSGKEPLTFNEVIDTIAGLLGKRVFKLHFPLGMTLPIVSFYNRLSKNPKIKTEQLLRLNEDKVFDHSEAAQTFQFNPVTFKQGIAKQIERMRSLRMI